MIVKRAESWEWGVTDSAPEIPGVYRSHGDRLCAVGFVGGTYYCICTRDRGHTGRHNNVSGLTGFVLAVWP